MTGFGKRTCELSHKNIIIQLRALNSKQLDVYTKMPGLYKEKDLEIRKLIAKELVRGKIELSFYIENTGEESNYRLNKELAKHYYEELSDLEKTLGIKQSEYLSVLLKMPDVLKTELQELDETEWKKIRESMVSALKELNAYRENEGKAMEKDIVMRIKKILELLTAVEPHEKKRLETVKERITTDLKKYLTDASVDKNRFEQEMFYYIEKMDITEEKVRLKKHCEYFLEIVEQDIPTGKKLGFVSQEIGREINTLGSKANNVELQQIVVNMKDELEKIKEQLLNIL
jgi:uncharacterized protein (TIGR00255 family)